MIVNDNKSDIVDNYGSHLKLNPNSKYEIALVNLETWHRFPNVDASNNKLKYPNDNGVNWYALSIPEGSYELYELNKEIERQMKLKNHYDRIHSQSFIKLSSNTSTLKSIMEIATNYKVDFGEPNSLNTLLGLKEKVYHTGYKESENSIYILSVNSIFITINIINGSYVNGSCKPVIYSFFPEVRPGFKIVETPRNLVYLPVNCHEISTIEVNLTNKNDKIIKPLW